MSNSGGQDNLSGDIVKSIPIALPPVVAEQEAIAEALGDADAVVESLEQLIAKKRQLKHAVMQQLLTGEKRLPGFEGEWELQTLGDVATLQRGFDLPNSSVKPGDNPVVYSNGILKYHNEYQVKAPGVVTGRSGTIGSVTFVTNDFWPHNTALWVSCFHGNNEKFIYYLLVSIRLERFAGGSGVPTLNRNDVHEFSVPIPPTVHEQTAIANILTDMDDEITALENRLAKVRHVKRGMMQELLTGRVRLV